MCLNRMENLYGGPEIAAETHLVHQALWDVGAADTAHPFDAPKWTANNPLLGHCAVVSALIAPIWGKDGNRHWREDAFRKVWWVYNSREDCESGPKKNKLNVHYSLQIGPDEIDLTREQFHLGTYLYPRPHPLSHIAPISRSWSHEAVAPEKLQLLRDRFVPALWGLIEDPTLDPIEFTPQFEIFLDSHPKS